jgi:SOS-response transcriptional repressor LexA
MDGAAITPVGSDFTVWHHPVFASRNAAIDKGPFADTPLGEPRHDILIVDRAIAPHNNCKAVCYIDGEYTVKRVEISDKGVRLMPANENSTKYKPIEITPENNFIIWGVVSWVIKKM